jgi:hypothetical protein
MKKPLFLLILLAITLSFACKRRFPDGPLISFRTVNHRLEGTWKVTQFLINGADSTDEFNAKLGCEIEFSKNTFQLNGNQFNEGPYYYFYLINCNNGMTMNGFWLWDNNPPNSTSDDQNLDIIFYKDSTFTPVMGPFQSIGIDEYWSVLRLTNKECNIGISACFWNNYPAGTNIAGNNNVYTLYLKKQ